MTGAPGVTPPRDTADSGELLDVDEIWRSLVTTALLGTDRRDPPVVADPFGELVDDLAAGAPSERMLSLVGACVAVRRAGVRPGPPRAPVDRPADDERPVCPPEAVDRWRHVVASWPVLEDEWTITLIERGWRLDPSLVPPVLRRHRRDAIRHGRAIVAAGPVAPWLVEHRPDLGSTRSRVTVDPAAFVALPDLPVPPDLAAAVGDHDGPNGSGLDPLVDDIASARLGAAHRAVLVNLVARLDPARLAPLGERLASVDPMAPGHPLASVLSDLVSTRAAMLDELDR